MRPVSTDMGVAAVVRRQGRVLVVRESNGPLAGRWGLPKGVLNAGELPEDGVLRELHEETGLSGCVTGFFGLRTGLRDGQVSVFLVYEVLVPVDEEVEYLDSEIDAHRWINRTDLNQLDILSPAMREFLTRSLHASTSLSITQLNTGHGPPTMLVSI